MLATANGIRVSSTYCIRCLSFQCAARRLLPWAFFAHHVAPSREVRKARKPTSHAVSLRKARNRQSKLVREQDRNDPIVLAHGRVTAAVRYTPIYF